MNNWGLTVSNPLSLDRTGNRPFEMTSRRTKHQMKENRKSDFCLVWMSKNLMWCVKCLQTSRQQNLQKGRTTKICVQTKSLIGKLKSLIQIHPVLPLHSLIKLWRMRTIRTCHVCHFLSPSFNSLQRQWPHLDLISWPNPTWAGLWSSASSISATPSERVTLD